MKSGYSMKERIIITLVLFAPFIFSCKKEYSQESNHNLIIQFKPVVDTEPLVFGKTYSNYYEESYQVSNFKFYISHITLINTDSNIAYPVSGSEEYLVNFADSLTTRIRVKAKPFNYNRISFTIGVDSSKNTAGAQLGALDPLNGMFWTWNTGYIMAKLEGSSPLSNQPNNRFEYHIGGYKGNDNVLRKVTLLYPFGESLIVSDLRKAELKITANANAWFYNPHELRIADRPVCTTPGALAKDISENYSKMFTVGEIVN
jgi:hypothetical protein